MAIFDYQVNVLTSRSVRVMFSEPVDYSGSVFSNYEIFSISPGVYLPVVVSVRSLYPDSRQFEVFFEKDLTLNGIYSLVINNVISLQGNTVNTSAHNFQTFLSSGPIAIGCFQSRRSTLDVVFDRPVGPYTASASGTITDGSSSSIIFALPYSSAFPDNIIRFNVVAASPPTADQWFIDYVDVMDESLNLSSGRVPVILASNIPKPFTTSSVSDVRLTDVLVTNVEPNYNVTNLRLFFNMGLNSSASYISNYLVIQNNSHVKSDSVNSITIPSAFDLPSLILLVNDIKLQFNNHAKSGVLHRRPDLVDQVDLLDCFDQPTAATVLAALINAYENHHISEVWHYSKDSVNELVTNNFDPLNLMDMITVTNDLATKYAFHISNNYVMNFSNFGISTEITSDLASLDYKTVDSDHFYSVDLRIEASSSSAIYIVFAQVSSSDGVSNTTLSTGVRSSNTLNTPISSISSYNHGLNSFSVLLSGSSFPVNLTSEITSSVQDIPCILSSDISFNSFYGLIFECMSQFNNHRTDQTHTVTDLVNILTPLDVPTVATVVDAVNILSEKFYSHARSSEFHGASDVSFPALPDATDLESAKNLLLGIRDFLNIHGSNANLHDGESLVWSSSPVSDIINIDFNGVQNLASYSFSNYGYGSFYEPVLGSLALTEYSISSTFYGLNTIPDIASAIPLPAISLYRNNPGYTTDSVVVYFNKPMDVTSDLSLLNISGGSLIIKNRAWTSDVSAEISVSSMTGTTYSVSATGLKDLYGNQVP